MTKLDSVTRFQDALKRSLGLKGNLPVNTISPVMIANSPTHDPSQGETRLLRGEKLFGMFNQVNTGLNGGMEWFIQNPTGSGVLSVITSVVIAANYPTPPAAAVLTHSMAGAFAVGALGPAAQTNPADGRVTQIQTRLNNAVAPPGTIAAPCIYIEVVNSTALALQIVRTSFPCLPVTLKPGQSAQVVTAWNIVLTVAGTCSCGVFGYERTADPSELTADGNVI